MRKAPLSRLFAIIGAVSTAAAAQSEPNNPQQPPAAAPGAATPSPSEWTTPSQPQPQPQPQPPAAQPSGAQPYPQQPNNNTMAPANNGAPPPAQNGPAYANAGSRDANNNYQRNDNGDGRPFNNEDTPKSSKFEVPTMSVRVDPFNWLLAGRLGFELESQVWKFISVELVPLFIVNDQPPYLNLNLIGVPNTLRQKSAGIGALAGTSVGVGFWLNGTPMEGYVLRAEITNYSINYDTNIDHVNYIEREFQVMIGQHSKWGPFTIAGTFGIGSMLNKHERCFSSDFTTQAQTSGCPNSKQMLLAVTPPDLTVGQPTGVINLNGWAYPIDLVLRISLGVVF